MLERWMDACAGEGKVRIGFWCEGKEMGKGGRDGERWRMECEVVG
jgi:hypothetical protein